MLHTISMMQALTLWSELERAYHGTNVFGSDTAEVYLYTIMSNPPRIEHLNSPNTIMGEIALEEVATANEVLYDFLCLFAKNREAKILVEGEELGPWLKDARFSHRVHVQVIPSRDRRSHAHQHMESTLKSLVEDVEALLKSDTEANKRYTLTSLERAKGVIKSGR